MEKLIGNIEQWAEDRNLIEGSTPQKQFIKLMEEFGELCSGVAKNKPDVIKDSIGDCFVVTVILKCQFKTNLFIRPSSFYKNLDVSLILARVARYAVLIPGNDLSEQEKLEIICGIVRNLINISILLDVDFESCVQAAWDEIKDRKGRMIDGVFVKEGDL
nr:MazG-like family protein [uncultured Aggregatibacter sp.]